MSKEIDLGLVVGARGKSAYEQAVEGGYTGTEAEFNALVAALADILAKKADLGDDDKVLPEQLPSLDYIPNSLKGAASGVALLGADQILAASQRPSIVTLKDIDTGDATSNLDAKVSLHRNNFRGKCLGTSFTAAQKAAIQAGNFDDFWTGDFWLINNHRWRIGDLNYLLHCGYPTELVKPSLLIVPDDQLGDNKQMNDTNVTTGGYTGSKMRTTNMAAARSMCEAAFGAENILTYRDWLTNAVANGKQSGGDWTDARIELMNEFMVYGHPAFLPMTDGSTVPANYTVCKTQIALFSLLPYFIIARNMEGTRQHYWLRDVVSAARFASVAYGGACSSYTASLTNIGVRPFFLVG